VTAMRTFFIALLLSGTVAASAPPHGDGERPAHRLQAEMERLGLSAGQRSELQSLAERFRAETTDFRQRADALRHQALATDPDDPRYAEVAEQLSVASGELAADVARALGVFRARAHAILTPAQRSALRDRLREREQPWAQWRERHHPAGAQQP